MTSSLVGSEMCIRDRAGGGEGGGVGGGGQLHRHVVSTTPTHPKSPHPYPVSYTHLTLPTICSV
eukprot:9342237-Prorocentrum_lima.AAC.1